MKKSLSPASVAAIFGVVALILVVAGMMYFKPSFGAGPVVQPRKFTPPAGYRPPSAGGGPGGPIGAPATAGDKAGVSKG